MVFTDSTAMLLPKRYSLLLTLWCTPHPSILPRPLMMNFLPGPLSPSFVCEEQNMLKFPRLTVLCMGLRLTVTLIFFWLCFSLIFPISCFSKARCLSLPLSCVSLLHSASDSWSLCERDLNRCRNIPLRRDCVMESLVQCPSNKNW